MFSLRVFLRLLTIFLPTALLTGGAVLVIYYLDRSKEHTLSQQAGTHLVKLQGEIINREMKTVESDLLFLANLATLRDFLGDNSGKKKAVEDEYLLFCRHRGVYDQIRYLDRRGQEIIRINYNNSHPRIVPQSELQFKGNRYYFVRTLGLERNQVFMSPLDLNVEHDHIETPLKPVIRFATPVFDDRANKKGILVLNYLGARLIGKLVEVSVTFPGQTFLLNRNGHYLRGPSRKDEWGFMLGHDRTFAASYAKEWQRVTENKAGQFATENGLFTFQALSPCSRLPAHHSTVKSHNTNKIADAADPMLIVVSYIPAHILYGQSTVLLSRLLAFSGVALLLLFGLAWYLAYAGALRRRQEQQLAESEGRLRTLSTLLITAQEDERRRLSRDLHDELGQLTTSVALDLQRSVQVDEPAKKDQLIERALAGAESLLEQIHEISEGIRPTILDDLGLKDAVQDFLSDFEQRTAIAAVADLNFERCDVPANVAENVYRILQEALSNVAKHAQIEEVFVKLVVSERQLSLSIHDQGTGFVSDGVVTNRLGILGMRERAELLNGTFTITSSPDAGTLIEVTIPVGGDTP